MKVVMPRVSTTAAKHPLIQFFVESESGEDEDWTQRVEQADLIQSQPELNVSRDSSGMTLMVPMPTTTLSVEFSDGSKLEAVATDVVVIDPAGNTRIACRAVPQECSALGSEARKAYAMEVAERLERDLLFVLVMNKIKHFESMSRERTLEQAPEDVRPLLARLYALSDEAQADGDELVVSVEGDEVCPTFRPERVSDLG